MGQYRANQRRLGVRMTKARKVMAVIAIALLSTVTYTGTAHAGSCNWYTPCGEVWNNTSDTWVTAALGWCNENLWYEGPNGSCAYDRQTVNPGDHLGGGNVDVDAFLVPTNCTYWVGVNGGGSTAKSPGWYRFSNTKDISITHAECSGA
jgi:hypothetical protein